MLDFFAGSGTTGDAVLQLNNDDGGGRKFILCNIEEEDQDNPGIFICSDICYSRIKSIIKGYTGATNGEIIEGLGGNLKYMRVGFVSREDIIENRIKFVDNIKDLICVKTDCFVEHTSNEFFKIFTNVNETNYVCIMYEREDIDLLKKEVKKIISKNKKDLDNIVIYIFSYSNFIPTKIFKDFGDLVKLCAIPEIMYEVYNEIQII